jgi:hypothetical protein
MLARRRVVCLFVNILMLRVNCDTDESDSQLLPTLDSDGDFSDCLYSDQFKQGVLNPYVRNLQDLAEPRSFRILDTPPYNLFPSYNVSQTSYSMLTVILCCRPEECL